MSDWGTMLQEYLERGSGVIPSMIDRGLGLSKKLQQMERRIQELERQVTGQARAAYCTTCDREFTQLEMNSPSTDCGLNSGYGPGAFEKCDLVAKKFSTGML